MLFVFTPALLPTTSVRCGNQNEGKCINTYWLWGSLTEIIGIICLGYKFKSCIARAVLILNFQNTGPNTLMLHAPHTIYK